MDQLPQARPSGLREDYAVLLDIGRILTGTLRADDLYRAIYEQASRVLQTDGFYLAIYEAASDTARVVFHIRAGEETGANVAFRGSQSPIIRERRPAFQSPDDPGYATLRLAGGAADRVESAIAAPILADGRVLGVIGAQAPGPDAYQERDLELLHAVAALAGVALGSAEFIRDTERRRREAERLEAIGRSLAASLELPEVLDRGIAATLDLVRGDGAAILLVEPDRRLRIAAVAGSAPMPDQELISLPTPLLHRLLDQRESILVEHLGPNTVLAATLCDRLGPASVIASPLIAGDEVIGIIAVGQPVRESFHSEDLRLLERLSFHVAIAVENARLHEQIRALSLTDPLTGLSNRRHMELILEKEFAAARRGRKLAVVMFDLDRFKEYNDTVGHQAGDNALRAFANVLAAETRAFDLAVRYGGDEFLSVLSDAPYDGALAHAARVERAVALHPLLGSIGVTAGIATYDPQMHRLEDLIHAADRELYRNKRLRL